MALGEVGVQLQRSVAPVGDMHLSVIRVLKVSQVSRGGGAVCSSCYTYPGPPSVLTPLRPGYFRVLRGLSYRATQGLRLCRARELTFDPRARLFLGGGVAAGAIGVTGLAVHRRAAFASGFSLMPYILFVHLCTCIYYMQTSMHTLNLIYIKDENKTQVA